MTLDLIYDIGVNDGSDTAYYLTKAERVIGVEASPVACAALRGRFSSEIACGRYLLLNIGIADRKDELTFWMCDDHPEWSSFDEDLAARGASRTPVSVQADTFSNLIRAHGEPAFAKIDIEGYDKVCLASLAPEQAPPFISVELGHKEGGELIAQLVRLGYRDFKIVSQRTMTRPIPLMVELHYNLPEGVKHWTRRLDTKLRGGRWDGDWCFKFGSSGAFGEKVGGAWVSAEHSYKLWRYLLDVDDRHGGLGLEDWFDIHARH